MKLKWAFAERTGKRIRELRRLKGLTQLDLSLRAHISKDVLRKVESGDSFPSSRTIKRLSDALEVEPERLFFPAHTREIVRKQEMSLSEAISVIQKSVRYQKLVADVPADIVLAISALDPKSIRTRLGLPEPEIQKPISKAMQAGNEARARASRERAARLKAEKERLLQLNYEKMMWEANKDALFKKPKMSDS